MARMASCEDSNGNSRFFDFSISAKHFFAKWLRVSVRILRKTTLRLGLLFRWRNRNFIFTENFSKKLLRIERPVVKFVFFIYFWIKPFWQKFVFNLIWVFNPRWHSTLIDPSKWSHSYGANGMENASGQQALWALNCLTCGRDSGGCLQFMIFYVTWYWRSYRPAITPIWSSF